jgi:hypothetical protein
MRITIELDPSTAAALQPAAFTTQQEQVRGAAPTPSAAAPEVIDAGPFAGLPPEQGPVTSPPQTNGHAGRFGSPPPTYGDVFGLPPSVGGSLGGGSAGRFRG